MILQLEELTKSYSGKPALDHFTYSFTPGIYGILGPNGAGKSTLMNLIVDNLQPDSGSIRYNETDTLKLGADFRKIVGFVPQQQKMYRQFSVLRFLYYMAALKGVEREEIHRRAEAALQLVNLFNDRDKTVSALSGGMRQRLLLAQAILDDPKILILDEPTAGLDPEERVRIRNLVSHLSRSRIVLYSTHVVSDIETIADQVLLLKKGVLIMAGSMEELTRHLKGSVFRADVKEEELNRINELYTVSEIRKLDRQYYRVKFISDEKPEFPACTEEYADLQDVYLSVFHERNGEDE